MWDDHDPVTASRMENLYYALIHVVYAATDDRHDAIGATAAALANFCATHATDDERETSLLRAIVLIRNIWKSLDDRHDAPHVPVM